MSSGNSEYFSLDTPALLGMKMTCLVPKFMGPSKIWWYPQSWNHPNPKTSHQKHHAHSTVQQPHDSIHLPSREVQRATPLPQRHISYHQPSLAVIQSQNTLSSRRKICDHGKYSRMPIGSSRQTVGRANAPAWFVGPAPPYLRHFQPKHSSRSPILADFGSLTMR